VSLDVTVFARHLDLAPLNGRRRGLVRCRFHEDQSPSLSLDLDRGVFHCFGCGTGGGIKRFSELVGEAPPDFSARPHARESDLQRARREAMHREAVHAATRAAWTPYWQASDRVRECFNVARDARQVATRLGPDHPRTWVILEHAAQIEREGLVAEAELDALLAHGRLTP
jgi:hypothetical protein